MQVSVRVVVRAGAAIWGADLMVSVMCAGVEAAVAADCAAS